MYLKPLHIRGALRIICLNDRKGTFNFDSKYGYLIHLLYLFVLYARFSESTTTNIDD